MSHSALFFRLALLLAVATATVDSTTNVEANGIMHGLPRALRIYIKPVPDTLFGWPFVVKKKAAEEEKAVEAQEGEEEEEEAEPIRVVVVVEPKEEEEAEEEEAEEEKEVEKKETNADVLKKLIAAKSLALVKGL